LITRVSGIICMCANLFCVGFVLYRKKVVDTEYHTCGSEGFGLSDEDAQNYDDWSLRIKGQHLCVSLA